MKIKIIDPAHECFGQELEGCLIYNDIYHRGGRPDLYQAQDAEGIYHRLLTDQIDTDHYAAQEIAEETKRLGANVGDSVMIARLGSGTLKQGFNFKIPHVITRIYPSGNVEFDHGDACGFQPDVQVVEAGNEAP